MFPAGIKNIDQVLKSFTSGKRWSDYKIAPCLAGLTFPELVYFDLKIKVSLPHSVSRNGNAIKKRSKEVSRRIRSMEERFV